MTTNDGCWHCAFTHSQQRQQDMLPDPGSGFLQLIDWLIDFKLAEDVKRGVASVDEESADLAGIQKGTVTHF